MKTIYYSNDKDLLGLKNPIFLAGPTLRKREKFSDSWRYLFLEKAKEKGLLSECSIIIPEFDPSESIPEFDPVDLYKWEKYALSTAWRIVFWVPRDMEVLPGLTTNIEFGEWFKSGKVLLGYPHTDEIKRLNRYLSVRAEEYGIKTHQSMDSIIDVLVNELLKPETSWFTSDTHFNQQRTLELSKRPYYSLEEMNLDMISKFNKNVRQKDKVYHLGDFGDYSYLNYLNIGDRRLIYVKGNYDRPEFPANKGVDYCFSDLYKANESKFLFYGDYFPLDNKYLLIHEPYSYYDKNKIISETGIENPFYLFGHIHGRQTVKRNGLDVGVDAHNFEPINMDTILFFETAITKFYDDDVFSESC